MEAEDSKSAEQQARAPRMVQSVRRAMLLLNLLAEANADLSLKELSDRSGLHPSTCHHLLATLAQDGFVGQASRSRGYFLGPRITQLSDLRLKQFDLKDTSMPKLRQLNSSTKECTHLSTLKGDGLAMVAILESQFPVRVGISDAGYHDAAHATASGKAMLAWLPEAEIARVIAKCGLKRFTGATICSIYDLMENLRLVRRNGYAMDNEEFQPGVVCVGAAIRNQDGAVAGAVSVSMPELRARGEHLENARRKTVECALAISGSFGSAATTGGKIPKDSSPQTRNAAP